MKQLTSGGGWPAIRYTCNKARQVGGFLPLWRALRSKNTCKTCAVGMGGQRGGMVNERGSFPEICKKSLQAMAADMQGAIQDEFWQQVAISQSETDDARSSWKAAADWSSRCWPRPGATIIVRSAGTKRSVASR